MARFDKRFYEKSQQERDLSSYIHKQIQKNNCKSLTEEQHNMISWLCKLRHDLHTLNYEDVWKNSDNEFWVSDYFNDDNPYSINNLLISVNLDIIEWNFNIDDYITLDMCYELNYSEEQIMEEYNNLYSLQNKINTSIEKYLHTIDKIHKTSYEPTGKFRSLI